MKKSTTALAFCGVALALGMAVMPLSSYAAIKYVDGAGTDDASSDPQVKYDIASGEEVVANQGKTGGEVVVRTTIDKILSLTIDGSNDTDITSDEATAGMKHLVLLSKDTDTANKGKIFNGGTGTGTANLTVATNNTKGYTLSIKSKTAETALVGALDNAAGAGKNKIAAITIAKAALSADASEWGYKTEEAASASNNGTITDLVSNFTGVLATDATIAKNAASTHKDGDELLLTFGVSADASQAADTYAQTVVLTAAANN